MPTPRRLLAALIVAGGRLAACAGLTTAPPLAPAQGSALAACEALAGSFSHPRTRLTAAAAVAAGELSAAGVPIGAHCRVTGLLNERTGPVDGKPYAIGFEMRLPQAWNG